MSLRLNVDRLKALIPRCDVFRTVGKLRSVHELLTVDFPAALGELCEICTDSQRTYKAEVVAVSESCSQLMTYERTAGFSPGMRVVATGQFMQVPVGEELLGRTLNGLGFPIDAGPPLYNRRWRTTDNLTPHVLQRTRITQPLVTGQRAIDGLLTIGCGQRIGLFAGSGVGKSTLLGEIARHAHADLNVIALVGERGREVLPFLEDSLGKSGREKSVIVVATSDESALMKVQAVKTAMTVAEDFRDQGANVLFFFDSLTRFANAQKEVGLVRGEVPGVRGFPSSVTTTMANLLERLGNDEHGSITGLITVLVEGDDMNDPIADTARSILDGHIVLDRTLAALGHYPAIDVLRSLSRLFREVTSSDQQNAAQKQRQCLATYEEVAELLQVGLYQPGTSPTVDQAVKQRPRINQFLQQKVGEVSSFNATLEALQSL